MALIEKISEEKSMKTKRKRKRNSEKTKHKPFDGVGEENAEGGNNYVNDTKMENLEIKKETDSQHEEEDEFKKEICREAKKESGIMSMDLFTSLPIAEPTMKAINDMGFKHMTQVIPN